MHNGISPAYMRNEKPSNVNEATAPAKAHCSQRLPEVTDPRIGAPVPSAARQYRSRQQIGNQRDQTHEPDLDDRQQVLVVEIEVGGRKECPRSPPDQRRLPDVIGNHLIVTCPKCDAGIGVEGEEQVTDRPEQTGGRGVDDDGKDRHRHQRLRTQLGFEAEEDDDKATSAQSTAERDTATGTPAAMAARGSQRRVADRARSKRARCRATGNTMARTQPNSIGWLAVPAGRRKPLRSRIEKRSLLACRPGI